MRDEGPRERRPSGWRGEGQLFHGPESAVAAAWFGLITCLVLLRWRAIEFWWFYSILNLMMICAIVVVSRFTRRMSVDSGNWIRFTATVVFLLAGYSELGYVLRGINPNRCDAALIEIDRWVFGGDLSVWSQAIFHPVAAEILQVTYATYYFLPVSLGILLVARGSREAFNDTCLGIAVGFYLSFAIYILFPAWGPRFELAHVYTIDLAGVAYFDQLYGVLDSLEPTKMDCFPSGHTLLTLLVLFYAAKYQRRALWVYVPLGTGIIVSTIYLRYHYAIDLVAGAGLAVFVFKYSPAWARRWFGEREWAVVPTR